MKYLNAINKISGIGPHKIKLLLNYFSNPEAIWKADISHLKQSGIGEKTAQNLFFAKKDIHPETEWKKLEKENIRILALDDPDYPKLLKESSNPPYLLYIKGNLDFKEKPALAIVGSRIYTSYGAQIARQLAKELAQAGIIIVSGMAFGIDSFAHLGALEGTGETIAVLGNSLDDKNIYPKDNFNLSRQIMDNGALISEYAVETSAGPLTFPARNRIIAGLTLGTLVVEAGAKSGALITARMALEYNREIFSVPGSIFSSQSLGTHKLIRQGAKIVTGVQDILEELNLKEDYRQNKITSKNPSNPEESKILKVLSGEPLHIDNISKLAKLQTTNVNVTLSLMEMKGWVKNIGGQNYILL